MKTTSNQFPALLRKVLFLTLLLFAAFSSTKAQEYKSAVGLRLGYYGNFGLDYKTFINPNAAIELIAYGSLYTYYKYFDIGALYEIQKPISDVKGLSWYYGGGAFVGLYNFDTGYSGSQTSTSIQLAGVLGLEYRFANSPITLSLDWIPSFAITGGGGFAGDGGSLAVRYIFN